MTLRHPLFERELPDAWRLTTVDEIKSPEPSSCVAGPFGSNISSKYFVDEGVPIIRGNNLRDDLTQFVARDFVFVSPERAKAYKAQHVRAGDLVFTCWGTIGQVGLIPRDGPFDEYIISNKQLKLRPDTGRCSSRYLFYYFASPEMVRHIKSQAIGAAVPGINLGILKSLPVVLPPLNVQNDIVDVLSAYDDLIENHTRRIKLLEEMARSLYREWFVHFRFPGHEKVKLVDSEIGKVPQGWALTPLHRLVEDVRDSVQPDELDPRTPYFGLEHLPRRSIALGTWGSASEVQSTKLRAQEGDILFGKIRPYFHKVGVTPVDAVCSSDTIVLRLRSRSHFGLVLACVSSDEFVAHATQTSQGTKMPRANWNVLREFGVPVPPPELLERFNQVVENAVALINPLLFKNNNLRATRDLLLPKLISGEIDVSDLALPTAA